MTRWPFIILQLLSLSVILVPVLNIKCDENNRTVINVGYLTALTGDLKDKQGLAISGALTLALEEINNDTNLLPNVYLQLRWNDTKGSTNLATASILNMLCGDIAMIFGPEGHCYVEAVVAESRNIPMISYKCSETRVASISTFARTEPPDTQVIKSVISLLRYYGWKKFSILHEESWSMVADLLKQEAQKKNMTINHKELFIDNMAKCCEEMLSCCRTGFWYQIVQNTMNRTRIYVFLGSANALVEFMASMDTANLFAKGEYMVIFVDMMTYTPKEAEKYLRKPEHIEHMQSCGETNSFIQRARSLLVVASTPPTDSYEDFTDKVREYNLKEPFNFQLPNIFLNNNFIKFVSIYAAYLYDSAKLYAWALDELLRNASQTQTLTGEEIYKIAQNGTKIIETIIKNGTYKSVTGATIKIDRNGDSEGNFSVLAYKPFKYSYRENLSCNFHMVPVAHFQQGSDIPEYKLINGSMRVDWPSGGDRPFDEPMCGFANELCKKDDRHITSVVAAGILGLLLFCAGVVTMSIYRKWKIELEIEGLLWKIDFSEIKGYAGNDILSSPSKLSLVSAQSLGSRCSNQLFTSTARWRGAVVRIKELKFPRKKDMSREIMKEMRLLRELRHDNVNSFIGACVESTRILLVTDYCAKGSLYDIIENEDIKLDDLFIASLIHDLIKGMIYIHDSSLVYHGNLKSSNCVVTSRWMLQVTDFGLHDLRHCAENESIGEHQHYRNQFWKAPEILRNPYVYGSQKGDVYAFAIIMYEIFSRKGPFGQTLFEPKEIVDLVKKTPTKGDVPFRPELECIIEGELCPDYVLSCITDCWHEDPDVRPDFHTIRTRLKKMRGGKTKNIMDQMMEMMEKYANNLEEIVTERTRLLCEEKRKTEDLLHRMLPQTVAEKLTVGLGVEPVSYDSVTIYFSDIVGFTAMSAESTPLQVVNFLNDLYTIFDRIIRGYDVYKVETIGDAYMVVSGLPIKNGDRHAGEIASMSLELLQAVKQHRIAHRPNEVLKLRIGMHTGPVVAGVVGLTMPRYCLFGDTVNTASRMESNGEALKIHISSKCKEALDKLEGYVTEKRGLVNMKGKGEVVTYWLVGATEKAIQKKEIDMTDLPPPLFCRPRKSPKLNLDSRQPSLVGMHFAGAGSRRQSCVPRGDLESNYSLQGSTYHVQRESPRMSVKRYDRPAVNGVGNFQGNSIPEYMGYYGTGNGNGNVGVVGGANGSGATGVEVVGGLNGSGGVVNSDNQTESSHASHSTLEHSEINCDNNGVGVKGGIDSASSSSRLASPSHKPMDKVRPHRIVNSPNFTQDMYGSGIILRSAVVAHHKLREAISLDPIPYQLRKRHEPKILPPSKLSKNNSRSLDTGVSLINDNPNGETDNDSVHIQRYNEATNETNYVPALEEYEADDVGLLMMRDNGDLNVRSSATIVPAGSTLLNRRRSGGGYSIGGASTGTGISMLPYKHLNNNCNGGITIEEDVQSPLLQRQASFNTPTSMDKSKRWHSLMDIEHHSGNSVTYAEDIDGRQATSTSKATASKKSSRNNPAGDSGNSSSILDRLVSIFHGNGKKNSESSLRRVGILPSAVRGVPGFSDISGTSRDRESIV